MVEYLSRLRQTMNQQYKVLEAADKRQALGVLSEYASVTAKLSGLCHELQARALRASRGIAKLQSLLQTDQLSEEKKREKQKMLKESLFQVPEEDIQLVAQSFENFSKLLLNTAKNLKRCSIGKACVLTGLGLGVAAGMTALFFAFPALPALPGLLGGTIAAGIELTKVLLKKFPTLKELRLEFRLRNLSQLKEDLLECSNHASWVHNYLITMGQALKYVSQVADVRDMPPSAAASALDELQRELDGLKGNLDKLHHEITSSSVTLGRLQE